MRSLERERLIIVERRKRNRFVTIDPGQTSNEAYGQLKSVVTQISGRVASTAVHWREAARIHLEYRMDRLWVVVEPSVYLDDIENENDVNVAKDFVRERLARRYNPQWNQLLDAWATLLFGEERTIQLRSFGCGSGVDATFLISRTSGYSWKGGAR